jgi:hypothetical protein
MNKEDLLLRFIRIQKTKVHIDALFTLLKSRRFNISNIQLPSYSEHELFVLNNPYRAWYLIEAKKKFIGSIYILKDNCIGIYVKNQNETVIKQSIEWVLRTKKPLPAIKSVRPSHFYINLSPKNKKMSSILKQIGAVPIQTTYSLKDF